MNGFTAVHNITYWCFTVYVAIPMEHKTITGLHINTAVTSRFSLGATEVLVHECWGLSPSCDILWQVNWVIPAQCWNNLSACSRAHAYTLITLRDMEILRWTSPVICLDDPVVHVSQINKVCNLWVLVPYINHLSFNYHRQLSFVSM